MNNIQLANEAQQQYINNPDLNNTCLIACAGSGKTRTLIKRCEYLINNNVDPSTIVLISFSRRSAQEIRERAELLLPNSYERIRITTIDALSRHLLLSINSSCNEVSLFTYTFNTIMKKDNIIHDFDKVNLKSNNITHIFIDEAQDLDNIQNEFLSILSDFYKCSIHLIGDPNQCIYQFRNSDSTFLMKHYNDVIPSNRFFLHYNFRSSNLIVNACQNIKPTRDKDHLYSKEINKRSEAINIYEDSTISFYSIFKSGEHEHMCSGLCFSKNTVVEQNTVFEQKTYCLYGKFDRLTYSVLTIKIMDIVNSYNIDRSEIAIVCPTRKGFMGMGSVYDYLTNNGVKCVQNYNESKDGDDFIVEKKKKPKHINLLTFHGTKGLEYEVVIILGMNNYLMSIKDIELYDDSKSISSKSISENEQYLIYVALSRAKRHLHVFSNGKINHHLLPLVNMKEINCYFLESKLQTLSFEQIEPERIFTTETYEKTIEMKISTSVTSLLKSTLLSIETKYKLFNYVEESTKHINITKFNECTNYSFNAQPDILLGKFCEDIFYYYLGILVNDKMRCNIKCRTLSDIPNYISKVKKIQIDDFKTIKRFINTHNIFESFYLDDTSIEWSLFESLCEDNHKCISYDCKTARKLIKNFKGYVIVENNILVYEKKNIIEAYEYINDNRSSEFNINVIKYLFYLTKLLYGIEIQHYSYCKKTSTNKDFMLNEFYVKIYKQAYLCAKYYIQYLNETYKYIPNITLGQQIWIMNDRTNIKYDKDDPDSKNKIIPYIIGVPDHYEIFEDENNIIEIKTTKRNTLEHLIQLIIYKLLSTYVQSQKIEESLISKKITITSKIINILHGTITEYTNNLDLSYIHNLINKIDN